MVISVESSREVDEAEAWYFLWSYCTDEVIVDAQKSCFGGMMFAVGWLVRIE